MPSSLQISILGYETVMIPGASLMTEIETFNSVWDALADRPEQASSLRVRTELMRQIAAVSVASGGCVPAASMDNTPTGMLAQAKNLITSGGCVKMARVFLSGRGRDLRR